MPWISIILTKNIVLGHSLIKSVGDNIFCNECGTENPDDGKFCSKCGYNFGNQGIETNRSAASNITCPKCNSQIVELKKSFPTIDFIVVMIISLITLPLAGLGLLIALVWFAWYFSKKPDVCPICNNKIKFDRREGTFAPKHWYD